MTEARQSKAMREGPRVDLPGPTASWVLGAHAFTLLVPLVLIQIAVTSEEVAKTGLSPGLLVASALLYIAASAFEIRQNAEDRWYFTGVYPARWDFLFQLCLAAGSTCIIMSSDSVPDWAWIIGGILLLALPPFYLRQGNAWPLVGLTGFAAATALYQTLGTPVAFLQVVVAGTANPYFLGLVTQTRAQSLHGALAFANGAGFLAIPWAIAVGSSDDAPGWPFVIAATAILIIVGIAFRPVLGELAATPHRVSAE